MVYSEAAYFDGVPVAHIAAYEEFHRLRDIERRTRKLAQNISSRLRGRRRGQED